MHVMKGYQIGIFGSVGVINQGLFLFDGILTKPRHLIVRNNGRVLRGVLLRPPGGRVISEVEMGENC